MKKLTPFSRDIILILIIASLSSCYTLNTHQSGKTLGKGNASVHGLAGYVIYPDFVDSTNTDVYYFSEAHGFASFGVRDDLDLGLFLGLGKNGLFVKHQFVGNLDTKFNISGSLNATMGLNQRSVLDSFSDEKDHQKLIELPLYVSYDFKKYFTVCSSPVLTYMNTDGSSDFVVGNDFYQSGFYRGLSGGLIPLSSQRITNMRDFDVYDANGVNHLEVGNHPRMTEILNQIFNLGENTPFHRPER